MAAQGSMHQQINVDELAKEKVLEVERLLNSTENHRLDSVNSCLSILKQIITAADLHRTNDKTSNSEKNETKTEADDSIYADYADDSEQFNAVDLTEKFASNSVKWTIRVQAFKLVHRLVHMMFGPQKSAAFRIPIMSHLSDLVRLSFVAATSPYDDLKLQGFEMFKFLINRFAWTEEKGFPGQSVLAQYKTQVLSALKPAFNLDAPPYITAIASQVCCLWICRGLEKEPASLRRTYQLMLATIEKLENQSVNQNSKLYTESEMEQERLDILGSWAQLYITAKESDETIFLDQIPKAPNNIARFDKKYLHELVKIQIESLVDKWWEALKDYALLIMPSPRIIGGTHDSEHVYTREVALRLFGPVWPRLMLATTIWLCCKKPRVASRLNNNNSSDDIPSGPNEYDDCREQDCDDRCTDHSKVSQIKYFRFICGIIMKELCRRQVDGELSNANLPEATTFALRSLNIIVNNDDFKSILATDITVAQEFYIVLYSILASRAHTRSPSNQLLKNLLDQIFSLVVMKISEKEDYIYYGIAHLAHNIKGDLASIKEAIKLNDTSALEILRSNFSIRVSCIINTIKLQSELALIQPRQRKTIIKVFQTIISFKTDLVIASSPLERLRDLCTVIPPDSATLLMSELFGSKIRMVSSLLRSIEAGESGDQAISSSYTHLEAYLKSINLVVNLVDIESRPNLISSLLRIMLEGFLKFTNAASSLSKQKKDLLDWVLKHILGLQQAFPDVFEKSLSSELKAMYDSILKLQSDLKTDSEAKRNAEAELKQTSKNQSTSTKPRTKIVLKADFSNFYAKKS